MNTKVCFALSIKQCL